MATPPLSELEPLLASLNTHKAPGASKAKIGSLTKIAVGNIEHEQQITQSLYRALEKAPATHKLGVLYVIDSIIRQWIEGAKKAGLDIHIEGRGEPGTYPAAIKRVTELMPALIDDLIKDLPADQKPKLDNILAIWERAGTFPVALLEESRKKVAAPVPSVHVSGGAAAQGHAQPRQSNGAKSIAPIPTRPTHTPVGYPPQHLYDQGFLARKGQGAPQHTATSAQQIPVSTMQPVQSAPQLAPPAAAPTQNVDSILAALRMVAPPPQQPQPMAQPVAPLAVQQVQQSQLLPGFATMMGSANGFAQNQTLSQQPQPMFQPQQAQVAAPPFNMAGFQPPPGFPIFAPPPSIPQQYALAPPPQQVAAPADPLAPLRSILPPNIVNNQQKLVKALNLLQELQKEGVPMNEWGPVIQALDEQDSGPPQQGGQHNGYNGQSTARGRSRSPDRGNNGRGSPVYNAYEGPQAGDQRNGRNGGREKQRYRQRSPMRNSPMPQSFPLHPPGPKFIQFDNSLPPDSIRVLSRTLFVGGANGSQQEIADLFGRFGQVASCIPNREKRHAFVKMTTRDYTLAAKAGVEALQSSNDRETMGVARQVKWGVGFGPRECFDYTRGESVIPIQRLTEADMKWIKTAPYGGTGGQELQQGMVLEEPDIEIGAGVSSKAMSKRVGPDSQPAQQQQQQFHQPQQTFNKKDGHGKGGGRKGRFQHHSRDDVGGGYTGGGVPQGFVRPEPLTPVAVATPPAVPGFGFTLPGGFR